MSTNGLFLASVLIVVSMGTSPYRSGKPAWNVQETVSGTAAQRPRPLARETRRRIETAYARMPLRFEPNMGQTRGDVRFHARSRQYELFLMNTEAVLALDAARLRLRFINANPASRIVGLDPLPGRVHYVKGRDRRTWHTDVATYAKVAYQNVYRGVDVVFYGNDGLIGYDFTIAPDADPTVIRLGFDGVSRLAIDTRGDLVLHTPAGQIRQQKPFVYQEVGDVKRAIAGAYVIRGREQVGFRLGPYDTSLPLVIDPVLSYSTYLGGSNADMGYDIAADANGNAYVTGETRSLDFPTVNPFEPVHGGGTDVFVTKISADGTALVYSTYLGGAGNDGGKAIAVDQTGQVYVSGDTRSVDFPVVNALQPVFGGGAVDAFVAKLTVDGSNAVYSTYIGGSGNDLSEGVAADASGNAFVAGHTTSFDFPTVAPLQPAHAGGNFDAFLTKVNATGSAFFYSTYLGGDGFELGSGIAIDASGNAYVTGFTTASNFPTTPGAFQVSFAGAADAYVTKVDATGSSLVYSTFLGGSAQDVGADIAVDSSGLAYVVGETRSPDLPTANAIQPTLNGLEDAFVTKLSALGTQAVYSTYLGGSGSEIGESIGVDESGTAYVAGFTSAFDFPVTSDAVQPSSAGGTDAFVTTLAVDGSALLYSSYLGGGLTDVAFGIFVDEAGAIYVTGWTTSLDFPIANPLQPAHAGGKFDSFVTKIGSGQVP